MHYSADGKPMFFGSLVWSRKTNESNAFDLADSCSQYGNLTNALKCISSASPDVGHSYSYSLPLDIVKQLLTNLGKLPVLILPGTFRTGESFIYISFIKPETNDGLKKLIIKSQKESN
jgi:hypothetical protein